MSKWGDPTDCFTEEEERKMEEAYREDLEHAWQVMMDEAFEALVEDLTNRVPDGFHSGFSAAS